LLLRNISQATLASRDSGWKTPLLRHKPPAL
jgi:hypothetical protein